MTTPEPTLSRLEVEEAFAEFCEDSETVELVIYAVEASYPALVAGTWEAFLEARLQDKALRAKAGAN